MQKLILILFILLLSGCIISLDYMYFFLDFISNNDTNTSIFGCFTILAIGGIYTLIQSLMTHYPSSKTITKPII